jgi:hypothetical protein
MASIVREVVIEAGPAECRDAVRDFAAQSERLVPGFMTGVKMVSPRASDRSLSSAEQWPRSTSSASMTTAGDWPTPSSRVLLGSSHHN